MGAQSFSLQDGCYGVGKTCSNGEFCGASDGICVVNVAPGYIETVGLAFSILSQIVIAEMNPADHAFMQAMHTMDQGMKSAQPTGNADKDLVTMMLPHHKGAVDMAKVEIEYGKDPQLRTLAGNII